MPSAIGDRRDDAVDQARIGIGDDLLLHRAARCAVAHREDRHAEFLDELLLDLVGALGRNDRVGARAERVERRRGDGVAVVDVPGQAAVGVTDPLGRDVQVAEATAHVVAVGARAGTEAVQQLAVPSRVAAVAGGGERARRRIVRDRDDVGGAVDDADLLADDHRLAAGALIDVRRPLRGVEGPPLPGRVAVVVGDLGDRRALRLQRIELLVGAVGALQAERLDLAQERRVLRTGEQRRVDVVDVERDRGVAASAGDRHLVGAELKAGAPGRSAWSDRSRWS